MAFGNEEGKRYFFRAEGGKLMLNKGKGNEPEPQEYVDGVLTSVSIYEDAAPGYEPSTRGRITLTDGQESYIIESGAGSLFMRMFAGHLGELSPGDHIKIRARQATEQAGIHHKKMTNCFVEVLDQGGYQKVKYSKLSGDNEGELLAAVIRTFKGSGCYQDFTPKQNQAQDKGRDPEAGAEAQFYALISKHNWPPFAINEGPYFEWFSRALKTDSNRSNVTPAQWTYMAGLVSKTAGTKDAPLPKEIRDLARDEYDPFADE